MLTNKQKTFAYKKLILIISETSDIARVFAARGGLKICRPMFFSKKNL